MRIAYFDCFSGISGDMVVGAFLDAGLGMNALSSGLKKLGLGGYEIRKSKVRRGVIAGTKFDCVVKRPAHSHKTLYDILKLIGRSPLEKGVKETASSIFMNLARAEARVHGVKDPGRVTFHEVGDTDSIVDIVGTAIALSEMGIGAVHSSAVRTGSGYVECAHGALPVPCPAAVELLKGAAVKSLDTERELVTPTGAAILKTLAKSYGPMPEMTISAAGYGAGSRDGGSVPNMLRVIIGEASALSCRDRITAIETNIDDMNPQVFEHVFGLLFDAGALDVYLTNIIMKKSRPGFKLTILCEDDKIDKLCGILFRETTSIGARFCAYDRIKLDRRMVPVNTGFGKVRVKVSSGPGGARVVSPEYDDCARLARSKKIPFKVIYDEAKFNAVR